VGATATVLVIDDDPDVRRLVRAALEQAHMRVVESAAGLSGLRELFARRPDAVVLDLALPGIDGWQVLERIREMSEEVPVLILSGHDQTSDRVRGLRGGADDFMGKPFQPRELAARIEALMRRSGRRAPERAPTVDTGFLRFDPVARTVAVGGRGVELTPLEFRLLATLCRDPGAAVSTADLIEAVWGEVEGVDATGHLNVVVSRLRKKLGSSPETGESPVETVRGFGYRLATRPGPPG
jgi:DNA-binding response OmpR family regulator